MAEYAPLPDPSLDRGYSSPVEVREDVADDVRAAVALCTGRDDNTREAYKKFADSVRSDGGDPVAELNHLAAVDEHARRDPNIAVAEVDRIAAQPRYVKPDYVPDRDEVMEATRQAYRSASDHARFGDVAPAVEALAHRNGDFSEFVDNALNLRRQARAGGEDYGRARETVLGHYAPWAAADPNQAAAVYDVRAAVKVFPDLDPNHPRFDRELRDDTARILYDGDFPKRLSAVQTIREARDRALKRARGR